MMTFNPAAAAAFSQAQLLAAAQQQHRPEAEAASDAINHYLANARGIFSGNGQFPFNAVQNNLDTMSLMSAGMVAGGLPAMSYSPMALQRIQEYHNTLQSASASSNQATAAAAGAGGPFPSMIFDGSMGFHPYAIDTTRRKNATRETTLPLKNWLNKHWKNPYPTKGEKLMLAVLTKMSLTQVSTWFANARRRLKKEKKWSPPNRRIEDGDDDDLTDNMDRPSSSNSNESDEVKDEVDVPMVGSGRRLTEIKLNDGDADDSATPIKRPIWSIADTIHTPPNIDKPGSHKNCESETKLKEDATANANNAVFNLAQNMLQLYPSGLSSQELIAAYQRMLTPQVPSSFPQNLCGFNPMLLAAFNQPGSAMGLSADTTSSAASSKQNGLSSVSPTSSTASQDPTKLTNSSSEDEKSSATPTSAFGTTTPLSTPQKSPSRSPTPSSTN